MIQQRETTVNISDQKTKIKHSFMHKNIVTLVINGCRANCVEK